MWQKYIANCGNMPYLKHKYSEYSDMKMGEWVST